MKEYMIHIWGGAFNKDANPSIEKILGITEGYYYFDNMSSGILKFIKNILKYSRKS